MKCSVRIATTLAAALAAAALGACASHPPLRDVSLEWRPSTAFDGGVAQASSRKVSFESFKDERQRPELIGQNDENTTPRTVTTRDDVGAFIATHMRPMFDRAGVTTVDSGGDVVLSGEVRQFFVEETGTYNASVSLHLTARDRSGTILWEGQVSGSASTFGRSYSMENYDQVLSDSIIEVTSALLKDPRFRDALAR